jgi:transcriptional regulator with XRE-family HTH domain
MPARHRKPSQALLSILSANIVRLRDAKKWSQEALADEAGLHRTYVGSVERCERNVTISSLEAFASAFGVSVTDLLSKRR